MSDSAMIDEFKIEAYELFQISEDSLINIEKGIDFVSNYNSIFRAFHSLKGAAGMFGMDDLQAHMHKLESLFEVQKAHGGLKKHQVDYFLRGVDSAKSLIDGVFTDFVHIDLDKFNAVDDATESVRVEKVKARVAHTENLDRKSGVIFLVDDEPDLLEMLELILENNDYVIYKFYNGKEALDAFEKYKPDLIVSDIMMPVMGGLDMLKEIRKIPISTSVIFISGNLSKEKMQTALKLGAYTFIDKPFDNLEVLNVCRNGIRKSRAMQLLEKSLNYILYQFHDLDKYLAGQGKENVRLLLKEELQVLLEQRKILKETD